MGYRLEGVGTMPGKGKIYNFSIKSRPDLKPIQPHIQWVPGALYPVAKWQEREPDYTPPSSAEVKNGGAISPLRIMC
jgi:hypothetical protein